MLYGDDGSGGSSAHAQRLTLRNNLDVRTKRIRVLDTRIYVRLKV
jgi:hypothetical protein